MKIENDRIVNNYRLYVIETTANMNVNFYC